MAPLFHIGFLGRGGSVGGYPPVCYYRAFSASFGRKSAIDKAPQTRARHAARRGAWRARGEERRSGRLTARASSLPPLALVRAT